MVAILMCVAINFVVTALVPCAVKRKNRRTEKIIQLPIHKLTAGAR